MDRLFYLIGDVNDTRLGGGDSFCDRLNCKYTVYILITFAILVTTQTYVHGDPISCWCPDHFTKSQIDYTNQICWVQNTYYLPFEEYIPKRGESRDTIGYYQWIGLFLACQAIIFYLPRAAWIAVNSKSGIAVSTITDAAIDCQKNADPETREKTLKYMVKHMGRFLKETSRKQMMSSKMEDIRWRIYGNYLVWVYLGIKWLYIGNIFGQLYTVNNFLGTKYYLYGFEVLEKLIQGGELSVSHRFPRVTMCDMDLRLLGNTHHYTIQCALPVNLFNEKIFIFIWFWFIFVFIATFCSMLLWLLRAVYMPHQLNFIKTRLLAMDKIDDAKNKLVSTFVNNYLRRDGIFIIRMVGKNSSDLIAAELICGLFDHYKLNKISVETLGDFDGIGPNIILNTNRSISKDTQNNDED